jgi:hypothetical protein
MMILWLLLNFAQSWPKACFPRKSQPQAVAPEGVITRQDAKAMPEKPDFLLSTYPEPRKASSRARGIKHTYLTRQKYYVII